MKKSKFNPFEPIYEESEERTEEELKEIEKGIPGFVQFNVIVRGKKRSYTSYSFIDVNAIGAVVVESCDFTDEFGLKDHVFLYDEDGYVEVYASLTEVLQKIRKAKAELRVLSKGRSLKPTRMDGDDDFVCKNPDKCISGLDKRYACPYWSECMECVYLDKRRSDEE